MQNDILYRIQESHRYLEAEIRKLLREVSRMAEQALSNARRVREQGASAIEAAWGRLGTLEREIMKSDDVSVQPSPMQRSQ